VIDFDHAHVARSDRRITTRDGERRDEYDRSSDHGAARRARSTAVAQQAALEAERVALEVERERRIAAEAERDRLREAYEALKIQVELARRRLVIAKAERVDTAAKVLFATTGIYGSTSGSTPTRPESRSRRSRGRRAADR
jgi:hypothetical protein